MSGQGVSCLPRGSSSFASSAIQVRESLATSITRRSTGESLGFDLYVHRGCAREALSSLSPDKLAVQHPALALLSERGIAVSLATEKAFGVFDKSDDHIPQYLEIDSEKFDSMDEVAARVKEDSCAIGVSRKKQYSRSQASTSGYSRQVHATSISLTNAFNLAFPSTGSFMTGTIRPQIAIVDDGVARSHPDLVSNISPNHYNSHNPSSVGGGNPYALYDKNNVFIEFDYHGTHVAGLAAAEVMNGNGVGGAAGRNAQIIAINALDDEEGTFAAADLINGTQWALNRGAHVVNHSNGGIAEGGSSSTDDELLLGNAQQNGALVVVAAGNTTRFCSYLTTPSNPQTAAVELNATSLNVPVITLPAEPTKMICNDQAYNLCRQQSPNTTVDSTADPCVYYKAYPYDMDDSNAQTVPMRWLRSRTAGMAGIPPNLFVQIYPSALAKNYACAISVAATDDAPPSSTALASFSSYGANTIEISAPGTSLAVAPGTTSRGLLSTVPGATLSEDAYGALSGTSMAAPVVAGAAAMAYGAILNRTGSVRCQAVCTEVKKLLIETADVVPALMSRVKGGRRLNVQRLMETINTRYPAGSPALCTQAPAPPGDGGIPLCN